MSLVWLNASLENLSDSVCSDLSVCVTEINRHITACSGKNMFIAVNSETYAHCFSRPMRLHSRDLITALLTMVIFSLSLFLLCVLVYLLFPACFGRLVNKALWESAYMRSISHHQGNRAAPSLKMTFPGTI